jgi:hypothetical protein
MKLTANLACETCGACFPPQWVVVICDSKYLKSQVSIQKSTPALGKCFWRESSGGSTYFPAKKLLVEEV